MSSSLTAFSADFLRRSLRMTAALTLLGSLWVLTYWGLWPALALLSGGAWGLVNILLIKRSVELLVTPGKVDRVAVWGMMLIKFPALYFAGYGLLSCHTSWRDSPRFSSWSRSRQSAGRC